MVIPPLQRRHGRDGDLRAAFEYDINDGFFIDHPIEDAAHTHIVQRLVRHIIGQIADTELRRSYIVEVGIALKCRDIFQRRGANNVAFIGFELLHLHLCIGCNRKNQLCEIYVGGDSIVASWIYFRKINCPVPTGYWLMSDGLPAFSSCAEYSADKIDEEGAVK